jgi:hypothetical protein
MLCCKAVYGGRLWRLVLILEFARVVQQSLGTSALSLSYVFVKILLARLLILWIEAGADQCESEEPGSETIQGQDQRERGHQMC